MWHGVEWIVEVEEEKRLQCEYMTVWDGKRERGKKEIIFSTWLSPILSGHKKIFLPL